MITPFPSPHERTVTVCEDCGAQSDPADEPHEIDDCPEHGVRLTDVTCWRPAAVLGVTRAPVLGTQADLERLGLVGGAS